jgi:hypothetical protein
MENLLVPAAIFERKKKEKWDGYRLLSDARIT